MLAGWFIDAEHFSGALAKYIVLSFGVKLTKISILWQAAPVTITYNNLVRPRPSYQSILQEKSHTIDLQSIQIDKYEK